MQFDYRQNWNEKLHALKAMHTDIANLCKNKKVAYIDLPLHYNVGDHLIYAGTEQFIKNHNLTVLYRAFDYNVDSKKVAKCDVILFHGGGNFGDMYPRHQKLRESIIEEFPDKRIIVLPQTIHFTTEAARTKSANVFKKHNDVHMFLRDQRSVEIAADFSEHLSLMPDMAHSLHPLIDKSEVENVDVSPPKILNLRRIDVEKVSDKIDIDKQSFDWVDILKPSEHTYLKYAKKIQHLNFLTGKLVNSWSKISKHLVFRSVNFFNSHNTVYTDRLHGLILSYLLGKNIKLLDNSYGKNVNYYNQWINDENLVEVMSKAEN